jgi:hypothetical protein
MPRYHFNTSDGRPACDPTGVECADLAGAKRLAVRFAGAMLPEIADEIFDTDFRLEVTNDAGLTLFSILVVGTDAPAIKS